MVRRGRWWTGSLWLVLGAFVLSSCKEAETKIPSSEIILEMGRTTEFRSEVVTDEPVPEELKQLNPAFKIEVYYREGPYRVEYPPETGAIFAKVMLVGVTSEHGLPDGMYYLWIGGHMSSLRAALAKVDSPLVKEVAVQSVPAVPEAALPHPPMIHAFAEPTQVIPRPPPPLPRPPPPPPPRRTWREICVTPAPTNRETPGKRWIRVPDG
ncbi:MAG: hypothetical protein J4G10_04010 [Alphaproteobacteria bacterium]|nr:hypothetical protein [Alphaproteobacteria bacterium]